MVRWSKTSVIPTRWYSTTHNQYIEFSYCRRELVAKDSTCRWQTQSSFLILILIHRWTSKLKIVLTELVKSQRYVFIDLSRVQSSKKVFCLAPSAKRTSTTRLSKQVCSIRKLLTRKGIRHCKSWSKRIMLRLLVAIGAGTKAKILTQTKNTLRRTNSTLTNNSMKLWRAMTRNTNYSRKLILSVTNWNKFLKGKNTLDKLVHVKSGQPITTIGWFKTLRCQSGSSNLNTLSPKTMIWPTTDLESANEPTWLIKNNCQSSSGLNISRLEEIHSKSWPNESKLALMMMLTCLTKTVIDSCLALTAKTLTMRMKCLARTSFWTKRIVAEEISETKMYY